MSTTFGQGPTALLGVTLNPLPVSSTKIIPWTVSLCCFILYVVTLCVGKNTVLHRSCGQWTPKHNRQSVD